MGAVQLGLLGRDSPAVDEAFVGVRRVALDTHAWCEHVPGWLGGHAEVFDVLRSTTSWCGGRRQMYERVVEVPRLGAVLPRDGPGHPALEQARAALARRYGRPFSSISLALYRDGSDSVAFHGDRIGPDEEKPVITVSLGAPRRFLLRANEGGRLLTFALGWGDLFVMGGACQSSWQHAVPKQASAQPRIAVMFR